MIFRHSCMVIMCFSAATLCCSGAGMGDAELDVPRLSVQPQEYEDGKENPGC